MPEENNVCKNAFCINSNYSLMNGHKGMWDISVGKAGSVVVQSDHKASLLIVLCTPVANKLMNRCLPTTIKSKEDSS